MIRPMKNRVMVKVHEEEKKSLILVANDPLTELFDVVALGEGVDSLKPGDIVYMNRYHGAVKHIDGKEYFFVGIDDIWAVKDVE